jgi:hypothetical protein
MAGTAAGERGMSERWMPIQVSGELDLRARRGERVCIVRRLPWRLFESDACQRQCEQNHSQSVERIAERGGFGAKEAIAVISVLPWERVGGLDDEAAHRILYAIHVAFNGGQRVAEARLGAVAP